MFRIVGNNGRRIKVSCTVTNAIPIKKDLLTAIADLKNDGISKCKVMGKTSDTAQEETVIYSLDTIIHEGDLVLDGLSSVVGAELLAGKLYRFGQSRDVSDGTNYAQHTVVFKVLGDLTIKQGVTLSSVTSSLGGPKGFIIYCAGKIQNDGEITMSKNGAFAKGENIYLFKNSNETFEFVPAIGGNGGRGGSRNNARV